MSRKRPSDLVAVKRGSPDFNAVARLRGRPPIVGKRGVLTVTADELERARALAEPVALARRWWLS